jgi:sugar O-acyltransferase (sialic acid O-acetyltransferase NeuD family)
MRFCRQVNAEENEGPVDDLLLFPFGGNAREALVAIWAQNAIAPRWKMLGFIDDNKQCWNQTCCDVVVLGGRHMAANYPQAYVLAIPGNPQTYPQRPEIIASLDLPPERFATIIDPSARIAPNAHIGYNTLIMAHVFISVSVRLGNHCVVLPNSVISHETEIGEHTLIGSNVSISSACQIGNNCYIGSGSRIKQGVKVGHKSMLGLGANVINDVPDHVIVVGNPARVLRKLS